jgi:DtxR family Mn-dependent transcriptional regulator
MTPTSKKPDALTEPVEDYLKAVYEIERSGSAAATTTLAARLGVAPASVSGMVRRLADQGLLAYEPYRGVTLTPVGRSAALRTLRRHRVLESYLTTVLGYPWDLVHAEAERLEHAASDELVDRMARALGDPTVDPHGAPIPTREGRVDETVHATLAEVGVGARVRVVRVSDADGAMLRYLAELGITPGTLVAVVAREPFGGPIGVEIDGAQRSVGPALAEQVLVQPED